ncbi:uncharacterized protein LOC110460895 [Mizuhopecten yessoensis]|uniref:uncharacterized protein LOC110460895 n=1 Tax=Mizuhopecten yessoensis TaxID=6573 RepID=UPI000B459D84|nr:uncharacterized protein LOC110460895 [Mizuhopecten yessoensis]
MSNSATPAVDTSDSHEMTIEWETTTVGETRTKEEMSNNIGDVSTETTLDTITDTTRVDNSVSTFTPSTVESATLTVPHICTGHIGVSEENVGKSLLSVRFAGGEKAVSVVAIEKELVELLVSAGYMVDSKEVKAIQTSFDGLTIVNITIDGADLALSATALADVGDRLCKEASMFLVQPPSPARTEDTDDGSGVIAGIVVLVAYLTTLFIIAVILVRRKYRERHRVSSRPMSEVSKVTKTAEQLLDRPETGMTGLSSEYEESNC